jgi:uncharacterized phage protein (TIGR02218 family)
MTTRPGRGALDLLRLTRGKRLCHLIRVVPQSIPTLLLTDHDRMVTFGGDTFSPISFGSMSADRREAAFRTGNQEVIGSINGEQITVPHLNAHQYVGAEVTITVVDWQFPWLVFAQHRKWIRSIRHDGSSFVGTLEGRSQSLQHPSGGRFGGSFTTYCPYELGDAATCKKDISTWEFLVRVDFQPENRRIFKLSTTLLPNNNPSTGSAFVDDFFRDGSIEWLYDPAPAGLPWTGLTTTTLTDSSASWVTDEHAGKFIIILDAGLALAHSEIVSNTSTVLTFRENASASATAGAYTIAAASSIRGVVSPIVSYQHSDRQIEVLVPTPKNIALGTWAIIRPGCDGLLNTCRVKFANQLNFGGDPFAPNAVQVIEPVDDAQ